MFFYIIIYPVKLTFLTRTLLIKCKNKVFLTYLQIKIDFYELKIQNKDNTIKKTADGMSIRRCMRVMTYTSRMLYHQRSLELFSSWSLRSIIIASSISSSSRKSSLDLPRLPDVSVVDPFIWISQKD